MSSSQVEILFPVFVKDRRSQGHYKAGYIDFDGAMIIEPSFDDAGPFSEGLGSVKIRGKWGAIGPDGKIEIEPFSDLALHFSEGRAHFHANAKRGVLSHNDDIIVGPKYRFIGDYSEDLAWFRSALPESNFGFLNRDGHEKIPTFFEDARRFSEGVTPVKFDGKWGYIDKSARFVITPLFDDDSLPFSEGLDRKSVV